MAHFSPMSRALENVSRGITRCYRAVHVRRIGVTSDIVRANGQVRNLQALDAVHVEALIEHTVLDDGVTLLGGHGARAERVPGGLDVALLRDTG
jgi:hypothetical protein